MSPLRTQMIRELELYRKSPQTIKAYVAAVADLAQHFGRSPERISVEEIRDLPAEEFLRRFLRHVLPDGFQRVRHYGLLANRGKKRRLAHCRHLLGARAAPVTEDRPPTAADWLRQLLGIDVTRCPRCGEPLRSRRLPPTRLPFRRQSPAPTAAEGAFCNTS